MLSQWVESRTGAYLTDEERAWLDTFMDPRHLCAIGELSVLLMVPKNTLSNWYARRDRNGFPEAVAVLTAGAVFDVNEVVRWYKDYVPQRGGRIGAVPRRVDGTFAPAG